MGWGDWIRDGVEVEPSLYAADFRRLGAQVDELLAAGCRVFHFDCGDGHFVPPVTIGPVVLRSIAPGIHAAGGVLDCHLMVDDPVHHFEEFAASGHHPPTPEDEPAQLAATIHRDRAHPRRHYLAWAALLRLRFCRMEVMITPTVTRAISTVQTALISGVTPSRTEL